MPTINTAQVPTSSITATFPFDPPFLRHRKQARLGMGFVAGDRVAWIENGKEAKATFVEVRIETRPVLRTLVV